MAGDIARTQKKKVVLISYTSAVAADPRADDPNQGLDYERVPGPQYLGLNNAGHFPFAETPEEVNRAIDEFLASEQERRLHIERILRKE
jgi:hypothetical protein